MAKHLVKCRVCGEYFDTNSLDETEWIMPSNRRYYHIKCYNDWQSKKDNVKTNDIDEDLWKDAAYQFLQRDLYIKVDFQKFNSQWKNLKKKGRTPKGIYFALRYFYIVQKGDRSKAQGGIGIVDYVYVESSEYWCKRERNGDHILAQIEEQVKQSLDREKLVVQKKKKKKGKTVDFAAIERMEFNDR